MFPQGILSQAYFMSALVGGGFLIFNFVMGHLDDGHDVGDDGGHDGGHDGHGDDGHDGGHGDQHDTHASERYGLMGVEHRLPNKILKSLIGLLSPMSIAIFLAFFGLTGLTVGYLMPWTAMFSLIPAVIAGIAMINIFKAGIRAMMKYGTSSSHMRTDDIIGQVAEVLVPIAENRPGEVTYVVQSKIYSSAARSKPGVAITKGSKVMIVETDGPTVYVEPYKELIYED